MRSGQHASAGGRGNGAARGRGSSTARGNNWQQYHHHQQQQHLHPHQLPHQHAAMSYPPRPHGAPPPPSQQHAMGYHAPRPQQPPQHHASMGFQPHAQQSHAAMGFQQPPPREAPPPPALPPGPPQQHAPEVYAPPPSSLSLPPTPTLTSAQTGKLQAEVTAFVEELRTSRSLESAPPNALNVVAAAQAICAHFHVNDVSDLLGPTALQLPALQQLQIVNQRVWLFVTCYVQTRRVNTLFECYEAFLLHENVRAFADLRMGNSFIHTDAVQTLYHRPPAMLRISTRDVLAHLREYQSQLSRDPFKPATHVSRTQFLTFLAQQLRQPRVEALGVVLDAAGFGAYVAQLRRLAVLEKKEMKALEAEFQRDIAGKVFDVTKDQWSTENRKRALDDLLEKAITTDVPVEDGDTKRAGSSHKSTMATLSLEMLKRVTELDVYLDNVLRRKASALVKAATAKRLNNSNRDDSVDTAISSQSIAATDVRIRAQLTQFVHATQKSKQHSRIKVVTWVLCGVLAKIHALLMHDDRLPEGKLIDKSGDGDEKDDEKDAEMKRDAKRQRLEEDGDDSKAANDSDDECDCCCVGKATCNCKCECECHAPASDDERSDANNNKKPSKTTTAATKPTNTPAPTQPSADAIASLRRDVEQYLTSYCASNDVASLEQLLMCLVSLEIHVQQRNETTSALEVVLELWNDAATHASQPWYETFTRFAASASTNTNTVASAHERAQVAQFVQQCYAAMRTRTTSSTDELLQQVTARAQCEFGADRLDALGVASLDELLNSDDAGVNNANSNANSSVVKYSNVLLSATAFDATDAFHSSLRTAKVDEAIAALRTTPFLIDVARHVQWQQRFAPSCGALRSFVVAHDAALRDHAASSVLFLFARSGVVLRVDDAATPSALELLVSHSTAGTSPALLPPAHDVAVQLVSMLVKCDGPLTFPTQLVQAHLRTLIAAIDASATQQQQQQLARFVLDVLLAVPTEFGEFVFLLLADAASESSSAAARTQLASRVLDACASDADRRLLVWIAQSASSSICATAWSNTLQLTMQHSRDRSSDATASSIALAPLALPSSSAASVSTTLTSERIADRFTRAQQQQQRTPDARDDDDAAASDASDSDSDSDSDERPFVASSRSLSQSPQTCEACIEQIRREQFGIGLTIQDAATSAVLAIQQHRLERALKRLSDELYSENTHFVLELLQNADDNRYRDGVRARGAFTLTAAGAVVFYNNERGFSRANIHAICDVGASTKAAVNISASGSIGKKGIGFKSVFKISDRPEVHSNGFHIRFHATPPTDLATNKSNAVVVPSGLGYILPLWIDDETQWQRQAGTTFVLPLNAASQSRIDEISTSLLAFEPSVLLFLRRLEELWIADDVHAQRRHFLKEVTHRSATHAHVQLFSQITDANAATVVSQQQWLVVKRLLVAPAAFSNQSDAPARETELAVALPLASTHHSDDRPPLQQVFAYLPLRSYGFRFIVQGDFETPSSREAIVNGSEWNQWLVSQVPALLQHAVACFVHELQASEQQSSSSKDSSDDDDDDVEATDDAADDDSLIARLTHLVALLPFEHEIQAPFRSVVLDTLRAVSETPLLPAQRPRDATERYELVPPVALLDAWDAVRDDDVLDVLTRASTRTALDTTLHKQLLHVGLAKRLTPQQKTQLRIERLKASHVLQLLTLARAQDDVQWSVELLRVLARVWHADRHAALLLQELRLIPCFPLQAVDAHAPLRWVSLADVGDALFLPQAQRNDPQQQHHQLHYESFTGDLCVLHDAFAAALEPLVDLRAFLRTHVQIKTIEDHDLIIHHILPQLEQHAAAASDGSDDDHIAAVVATKPLVALLATHVRRCGIDCSVRSAIHTQMHVWTTSKRFVATATAANVFVLLPPTRRELPTLTTWLQMRVRDSNASPAALDIVALDVLDSDGDDALWHELFVSTLALPALLDVTDKRQPAALKQLLQWLVAEPDAAHKQTLSHELATYLNAHWPTTDTVDAAVVELLRKRKWLCGGSDGSFRRAHKLWTPTPANKALFTKAMVPYSRVAWTNDAFVSDVLRLKRAPTLHDALDVLTRLASALNAQTLSLELKDVIRIYQFFADQAQQATEHARAIALAFREHALVFIPSVGKHKRHKFLAVDDVVWTAAACKSHLVALHESYPAALRHFFTDVCGVARKPSIAALCARVTQLQAIANDAADAPKQLERELLPICRFFAKQIRKAALAKDELRTIRRAFKTAPWLPTVSGRWCATQDAPLVAHTDDERDVLKLVRALRKDTGRDLARIALVKLDAALLHELEPLLQLTKIQSIDAHIVAHPSTWCNMVVHAIEAILADTDDKSSAAADRPSVRKRVHKLLKRVVVVWATAFAQDANMWTTTRDSAFQATLQQSAVFPLLSTDASSNSNVRYATPANVFLNDQTDLSKEQLIDPLARAANGDTTDSSSAPSSLPVLSLFPWSYFVDAPSTTTSDASQLDVAASVRTFLIAFCGVQSLQATLTYDVVVHNAPQQQPPRENAALRHKLQQSLGVAQRVLFHHHRALYDTLPLEKLVALTRDVHCVVVRSAESLDVVYRVGATFCTRVAPPVSFLDLLTRTLYVVQRSDDEDVATASFHSVLLEVCRKCFGAHVAPSVANVLYLASLQPSVDATDAWLVDTQHVAAVDSALAGELWAQSSPSASAKKRSLAHLEDGECDDDGSDNKRPCPHDSSLQTPAQWRADNSSAAGPGAFQPPLPPSTAGYDSTTAPPLPLLPHAHAQQHLVAGATASMYPPPPPLPPGSSGTFHIGPSPYQQQPFQPPLPPLSNGSGVEQIVHLNNTMSKTEREGIGRWGEAYVYKQLVASHKNDANVTVEWVNEHTESGKPYDITVSANGNVVEFVEVKATRTMEKAVFEISMNELDQAAVHGSTYCIYRVFNAGNDALCRVVRMKNPIALVRARKMQLALVMQ